MPTVEAKKKLKERRSKKLAAACLKFIRGISEQITSEALRSLPSLKETHLRVSALILR